MDATVTSPRLALPQFPVWSVRGGALVLALVVGVAAGVVVTRAGETSLTVGMIVCFLPAVPVLLLRPLWAAILAIALLPFQPDLAAGSSSINVAPSDALFVLCLVGLALGAARAGSRVRSQRGTTARALRPIAVPVAIYFAVALVDVAAHPTSDAVLAYVQRIELVVVPVVVAVLLFDHATAVLALRLYVASSVALALVWIVNNGSPYFIAGQKNPAGQFIAGAALLCLVIVPWPWRYPLFALLALGVYATQSRGALVGLVFGVILVSVLGTRHPLQVLGRLAAVAALLLVGYLSLPGSAQQRVRGETESTRNNDELRSIYATDAHRIIDSDPVLGVGPGNYVAGRVEDLSVTVDPHNVLLLQAAEGGYPLVAAFLVAEAGALLVALGRLRAGPWAAIAAAVLVATFVHALVDVYWVRGTPVLGWLLIGLVLAGPQPTRSRPQLRREAEPAIVTS